MFDTLPFGLETYIYTLVPDEVFIFLSLITLVLVILFGRYKHHILLTAYYVLLLLQTVVFRHVGECADYWIIPFRKIKNIINCDWQIIWEIGLNVVMFIPIGILLALIMGKDKWKHIIILGAFMSMLIEFLQLILKRGVCEIDDVIVNTVGCAAGMGIVRLMKRRSCADERRSYADEERKTKLC